MDQLAEAALERFGLSPQATATLCNVSENHTYRVEDPDSPSGYALRVHRPGYRTPRQIESELEWVDALREDDAVDTPTAVPAPGGERVVHVDGHNVVLWEWLPGSEPDPEGDAVLDGFKVLGAVSARMHAHARAWAPPAGFDRPPWDYDAHARSGRATGAAGRTGSGWGRRSSSCWGGSTRRSGRGCDAYGQGPERYGLVHADIRLANLLVDDGHVRVIDFDDSGFTWFMYDFATTVSFMEDHPRVPELQAAWLEGYRSVAPLDAADEAELATFVMLRRLLLVAWIGSHHTFATEAAELGAGFTAGTCALAERYLSTHA